LDLVIPEELGQNFASEQRGLPGKAIVYWSCPLSDRVEKEGKKLSLENSRTAGGG
jgi:hypothetical protein